jgi:diaminopimelate epimerase
MTISNADLDRHIAMAGNGSLSDMRKALEALAETHRTIVSVPDANTTILAANSGKPHLVANVSADRTFTLPAAAVGLDYEFIATVGAADGHDWIISTGSDTNYFVGAIVHLDTDANDAGDEIVVVAPDGNSNSKLQINLPQGSTRVRLICDGTLWCVEGQAVSVTAPAFADQ